MSRLLEFAELQSIIQAVGASAALQNTSVLELKANCKSLGLKPAKLKSDIIEQIGNHLTGLDLTADSRREKRNLGVDENVAKSSSPVKKMRPTSGDCRSKSLLGGRSMRKGQQAKSPEHKDGITSSVVASSSSARHIGHVIEKSVRSSPRESPKSKRAKKDNALIESLAVAHSRDTQPKQKSTGSSRKSSPTSMREKTDCGLNSLINSIADVGPTRALQKDPRERKEGIEDRVRCANSTNTKSEIYNPSESASRAERRKLRDVALDPIDGAPPRIAQQRPTDAELKDIRKISAIALVAGQAGDVQKRFGTSPKSSASSTKVKADYVLLGSCADAPPTRTPQKASRERKEDSSDSIDKGSESFEKLNLPNSAPKADRQKLRDFVAEPSVVAPSGVAQQKLTGTEVKDGNRSLSPCAISVKQLRLASSPNASSSSEQVKSDSILVRSSIDPVGCSSLADDSPSQKRLKSHKHSAGSASAARNASNLRPPPRPSLEAGRRASHTATAQSSNIDKQIVVENAMRSVVEQFAPVEATRKTEFPLLLGCPYQSLSDPYLEETAPQQSNSLRRRYACLGSCESCKTSLKAFVHSYLDQHFGATTFTMTRDDADLQSPSRGRQLVVAMKGWLRRFSFGAEKKASV